jgi:hypothetical protein
MDISQVINVKNFNWKTIASFLVLLAGILFYLYWGITYDVWTDIGIYSITIILVLFGLFGVLLSLLEEKEE